MWDAIAANLPRMKRGEPSTWGPVTEQESARLDAERPEGGEDPYFGGGEYRFSIRNGAEQLMLDLAPRPLRDVAEQLLGKGTICMAERC